ncbi:putative transcriptional regulator [Agromyces cerinus]|uniref:helix-turn-helix domain-containing protein n=1 Tax=Agromyces cerinus TaxID=33878 RepID=UPI0027DE078C|nr:helix-turn-helix transcriptional regulator [Agromyces cerinus]MBM7831723.1 putative transcriptional regulator [Agromyces cerinus]
MSSDRGEQTEHGTPRNSEDSDHRIVVHLAEVLEQRGMTLTELSERIGVTLANLSILKTGKARAVRFTTLTAICEALDTTPAELFSYEPRDD